MDYSERERLLKSFGHLFASGLSNAEALEQVQRDLAEDGVVLTMEDLVDIIRHHMETVE